MALVTDIGKGLVNWYNVMCSIAWIVLLYVRYLMISSDSLEGKRKDQGPQKAGPAFGQQIKKHCKTKTPKSRGAQKQQSGHC